jgi:uncharacterized delta-60 repeat protein
VAIDRTGRVVAAGYSGGRVEGDFALARYTMNGTLDPSFSDDGRVTTDIGGGSDDHASSVAVAADGRIVAGGNSRGGTVGHPFALTRYRPDGRLDRSFSGDGRVTTRFTYNENQGDEVGGVAIDSRGRIVAVGHNDYHGFALVRYNGTGSVDRTFGKVRTPFPESGAGNGAAAVAIDSRDRVVAAGQAGGNFKLARYIGYP